MSRSQARVGTSEFVSSLLLAASRKRVVSKLRLQKKRELGVETQLSGRRVFERARASRFGGQKLGEGEEAVEGVQN